MRTRLLAGIVSAVAVVASGCGGSAPDSVAPSPAPATSSTAAPATDATTSALASDPTGSTAAIPSTSAARPATAGAAWVTYHRDTARSGVDPSSPAAGTVTEGWRSPTLDGAVYAEPLVIGDQVLVATENNSVYAIDATTGAVRWTRHLGQPIAGGSLPCGNIDPSGITSTPVADPATDTVWVTTFEQPAHHVLYSLHLSDGTIGSSRAADPPGADPTVEQLRGALTLANGTVYVPYGGLFGDCGDYHGWVVGLPASGSGAEVSFKVPNDLQAGIWAPPGPALAADGSLFVATGNGTSTDGFDDADAVIRLSPTLAQLDAFAPIDWHNMNDRDQDLGTLSPALVDGFVLQVGKQGIGYLLDANQLGGVGGQKFQGQLCNSAFGATAVDGSTVIVPCRDGLHAVTVTGGPSPRFSATWTASGPRAGPPIIAGGVVWEVNDAGHLLGFDEQRGQARFDFSVGKVVTSFPSLAAADGRLFVPAGEVLISYTGV
jgi:outer membrane protein assembly factor BamB